MSLFGCCINVLVIFARLPDVQQVVTVVSGVAEIKQPTVKGLFKKYHTIFGALAEFTYVSIAQTFLMRSCWKQSANTDMMTGRSASRRSELCDLLH